MGSQRGDHEGADSDRSRHGLILADDDRAWIFRTAYFAAEWELELGILDRSARSSRRTGNPLSDGS